MTAKNKKQTKQVPVKVPRPMKEAVQEFLKTDQAKLLGVDSIADVVTEALRDFVKKYDIRLKNK